MEKDPVEMEQTTMKLEAPVEEAAEAGEESKLRAIGPITLVLWQGDIEFAPEGNIIFDATISDYLSTEDITVLCETITWRLVKVLKLC